MNITDLTEAAQCKRCKGTMYACLCIVDISRTCKPCHRCGGPDGDHPGVDPDVIHNTGPLRFNTMSVPAGIGAFVFVPIEETEEVTEEYCARIGDGPWIHTHDCSSAHG